MRTHVISLAPEAGAACGSMCVMHATEAFDLQQTQCRTIETNTDCK